MIETELKILLDARGMERLRSHPALAKLRKAKPRTQALLSIYYDTPASALAAAGIALRLRKVGRSWVQTIKLRGEPAASGFFSHREIEGPAPGGRLVLEGPDPAGALAAIRAAAKGAPLGPVFETRITRGVERLGLPEGEIELALDEGEVRAGEASAPIREAEIELKAGDAGVVFAIARQLFDAGPVRFGSLPKAGRGYQLLKGEVPDDTATARRAGTMELDPEATVEMVARDFFRDCLGQIADNMAFVAVSDAIEGPHQLRVGLRRLRSGFGVFGQSLGKAAMVSLGDSARDLGQLVGRLRDADVLALEVVEPAAELGLDAEARTALAAALEQRRVSVRAEVRKALAGPEAVGFLFDLGRFIEARGWLVPSDYGQTERLAAPIAEVAPDLLAKRHRTVMKDGRKIRELDVEGLHELRKDLKKLRYTVDMLGPIFEAERVTPYIKALRELQDAFGSLNDAAMAQETLAGEHAPAPGDPAAQRGAGFVLGTLVIRVADDRPKLFERFDKFAKAKPFWS